MVRCAGSPLLASPSNPHLLFDRPGLSVVTTFFRVPSEGIRGNPGENPTSPDIPQQTCLQARSCHRFVRATRVLTAPLCRRDPDNLPRIDLRVVEPDCCPFRNRIVSLLVDGHPDILHGSAFENPSPVDFSSFQVPCSIRLEIAILQYLPVAHELIASCKLSHSRATVPLPLMRFVLISLTELFHPELRDDLLVYLDPEPRFVGHLHLPVLYLEFLLCEVVNERILLLLELEQESVGRGDG